MRFTDDFIDKLRDSNDIESVISSYIELRRRGRNLVGLCPFHNEKTPSFTVYPETASYYCFGCGAGGDVIGFIRNIENLDYTLHVFYELNYVMDKIRFIGDDTYNYSNLTDIVKVVLRDMPKIKHIEIVSDGNTVPGEEIIDILRNPGMLAVIYSSGEKADEIQALFEERGVNYEICDKPDSCGYCKNTHTLFIEGKIFRCPVAAYKYANTGEGTEDKDYVDIVARKLSIKNLRLAIFDITNDPPPANCDECEYNK